MHNVKQLPIVGVMGSGSDDHEELAEEVGSLLAKLGVHLLTGGGGGVMSSVSRWFSRSRQRKGFVIGIIPCDDNDTSEPKAGYPNEWIEIPIFTHLPLSGSRGTEPMSRNHINILSCNAVIALPGGLGTASECLLAVDYRRPIVAYLGSNESIPNLDSRVQIVKSIREVKSFLKARLFDV